MYRTHHYASARVVPLASFGSTPRFLGRRFSGPAVNECNDLKKLKKKAEHSTKAVMITDSQGLITYVNPVFERVTGFCQAEATGKPASLIKSGLHDHDFYLSLWKTLMAGREFQSVFANRRRNGEIFFEEKRIRPFVDKAGETTYYVSVSHPVDEFLQATLLRLERLANHDPLTGLPNRNLFLDRLHQHFSRASRYGTRFALAYLDLDNFKPINDQYGHAAGDLVLIATARHIQSSLREEDTVGRLGGDEFGLILSNTQDENDVIGILRKVLAALALGADLEGGMLPISASIGAIIYPDAGEDPEDMMRQADRVMYNCKSGGGNSLRLFRSDGKLPDCLGEALPPLPIFAQVTRSTAKNRGKN
jgi:diguanylate cyclase (GGDEF)-like protein/PAS domain S-box-containing protein